MLEGWPDSHVPNARTEARRGPLAPAGKDEDRHGLQEQETPPGAAPTGSPMASFPRVTHASLQKCLPRPGGARPLLGAGGEEPEYKGEGGLSAPSGAHPCRGGEPGRGQRAGGAANTPGGTRDTAARTQGHTGANAYPRVSAQLTVPNSPASTQHVGLLRWFHCLVAQLSLTLQPRGL